MIIHYRHLRVLAEIGDIVYFQTTDYRRSTYVGRSAVSRLVGIYRMTKFIGWYLGNNLLDTADDLMFGAR